MSTTIIYEMKAIRIPGAPFDLASDLFLLAILSGSNNCYAGCGANAKRARSWGATVLGSSEDVIAHAIDWARHFEGGNTVWKNMGKTGELSAAEWIGKVRSTLSRPIECPERHLGLTSANVGSLTLSAKQAGDESLVRELLIQQLIYAREKPGQSAWHIIKVEGPGAV